MKVLPTAWTAVTLPEVAHALTPAEKSSNTVPKVVAVGVLVGCG